MILHKRPLRTIHNLLPLTNPTLLPADTILWCTRKPITIRLFSFLFPQKKKSYNSPLIQCPLFPHFTSRTSTKSTSCFVNSLATLVGEGVLYRPLTFHQPNIISLFHCLGLTKVAAQARDNCIRFVRRPVGGPTLVGCSRQLIQYIRSYHAFWRSLLLPQPEDALRRSDMDQLE